MSTSNIKRVILPKEFSDMSDFMSSPEFKSYIERKKREGEEGIEDLFTEGFVNEFKAEKEKVAAENGVEEVYLLSGNAIELLSSGKAAFINGQWIAISEKSEMILVEGLEKKWTKEWGLDADG